MKTTTRLSVILVTLLLGVILPKTQAVSPPPDGGYPGGNTAEGGSGVLFSLTTGSNNTALGSQALFSLTTGIQNTATGAQALKNNTADRNTADGFQALVNNTTGNDNVATGWRALFQNTTGFRNTAIGSGALGRTFNFGQNTAVGFRSQANNNGANGNTSVGDSALYNNVNDLNTAVGLQALMNNNAGTANIALGVLAGLNITDGSANIDIGNQGVAGDSNTIRIGTMTGSFSQTATFIAGISGTTVAGTPVVINGDGQLGVSASSERFKQDIRAMNKASEPIFALKPVTFRYKDDIDARRIPQFGLVAEDVAKVNPDLVVLDRNGKPFTVRYDAVNAMLLNEFLKEHRKVEKLEQTVATLASQLQKVTAKIGMNDSAAQLAVSSH